LNITGGKKKVFVLDDDLSVLRALKRLLESKRFDVEIFSSPDEFLRLWSPTEKGCLVLDIYLAGKSGIEFYQQLLDAGHSIPVIFITAHDDEWIREKISKMEGAGFLKKPFNELSFFVAVQKAMSQC